MIALTYSARRIAAGLCTRCGGPRGESGSSHFCAACHERHKTACRNRSRLKAGIPLDLPLQQSRTARAQHRRCLELEAAFRAAIQRSEVRDRKSGRSAAPFLLPTSDLRSLASAC